MPLSRERVNVQVLGMNWLAILCSFLGLSACAGDETISGFADPASAYGLQSIDGEPFGSVATISFPGAGRVEGRAPCNAYSASQTAPYPWFELGLMRATRMACGDLPAEREFFAMLATMTLAEVSGDVLILSNPDGAEMVF